VRRSRRRWSTAGNPHVGVEIVDDLAAQHEAMGIVAGIRETRQPALPIGRDEAERVPALGAPGVAADMAFEDQMLDAFLAQMPAQ
jgi:hypothetical protein